MINLLKKRKKIKSFIIYSLSFVLNKASMYLLLPLYTRVLSVELFGKYELLNTVFSFLLPLGLFGLQSAVLRFYKINNTKYNNKVFRIAGNIYKFSIIFYLFCGLLIYTVDNNIFNGSVLVLIFFISRLIIDGTDKIYKNRIRMDENEKLYFFLDIIKFVSSIILSILLLNIMEDKFMAIFLSISYSSIVSFILFLKKYFCISDVSKSSLKKEMINYSYPLTFNSIANWIFSLSDKFLINFFLSYTALGLYSAGFKLGALAQFLTFGFILLWPKWAIQIKDEENSGKKIEKILSVSLIVFIFSFILLYLIIRIAYPYFYEEIYQESLVIVPFIILSFMILGLDTITSVGIFYAKKTKLTLLTTVFAAIINIFLNTILLPKFGYYIAAITTYISNMSLFIMRAVISQRLFKIDYKFRTFFLFLLLNFILVFLN